MASAGALNRRFSIQSRSTTIDSVGGQSSTWTAIAPDVWGSLNVLSANEKLAAQTMQASVSHQITVRYQTIFADPKKMAGYRAVMTKDAVTRTFNIRGAYDEGEKRTFIIMDVEEGLNNG